MWLSEMTLLLGGRGDSEVMADGAGMLIAISLFHFSIFGSTSFSQFSIFGRMSPVIGAADNTAAADERSSLVEACALPRGCFLSRRPFNLGGNLPLLPRFCSACREPAYNQPLHVFNPLIATLKTAEDRIIVIGTVTIDG